MSNLNVIELDPPTNLRQFEENCANIRYVSDPLLYPVITERPVPSKFKEKIDGTF